MEFLPTTLLCSGAVVIASDEKIAEVRAKCGRTIEEILARSPEYDLYELLGAVEVLVSSKIYQKLPTSLGERMVFAFRWMALEVRNGGFDQYFFNSAGDFWRDVLDGLTAIGDERGSALFREVLLIFPDSAPSTDRFARQDQLESLEEKDEERYTEHFESADRNYTENPYPKWELLYEYVRAHTSEFDLQEA